MNLMPYMGIDVPWRRRHKLHIARFAASAKSSHIPLLRLSPKSLRLFGGPFISHPMNPFAAVDTADNTQALLEYNPRFSHRERSGE